MNVAPVSSLSQRSQDFDALHSALQTGNLSGAQTAFAAFLQDVQKTQTGSGASGLFAPGTRAAGDLSALGGALKSANLSGAQRAFSALQHDIQSAGPAGEMQKPAHHRKPYSSADIAANGTQIIDSSALAPAANAILNSKL